MKKINWKRLDQRVARLLSPFKPAALAIIIVQAVAQAKVGSLAITEQLLFTAGTAAILYNLWMEQPKDETLARKTLDYVADVSALLVLLFLIDRNSTWVAITHVLIFIVIAHGNTKNTHEAKAGKPAALAVPATGNTERVDCG